MTGGDLALALQGRHKAPLSAEVVRELGPTDLALLALDRGVKPQTIKRLRDSHHSIARCVAQGLSGAEIGAVTGYSQSRISILKGDPSFQELVAFYQSRLQEIKDTVFVDGLTRLKALHDDAVELLHERILDEPDKFVNADVLDVVKATADRTGLGPASKSTNVNVNIDLADRIARGRRRVDQLAAERPTLSLAPAGASGGDAVEPLSGEPGVPQGLADG